MLSGRGKSAAALRSSRKRAVGATTGEKKEPASEGGRYVKSKIARDGPRPVHREKKEPASLRSSGRAEGGCYTRSKIARDGPRPLHRGKKSPPPFAGQGKQKAGAEERSRSLTHQKAMGFGMTAEGTMGLTKQQAIEMLESDDLVGIASCVIRLKLGVRSVSETPHFRMTIQNRTNFPPLP